MKHIAGAAATVGLSFLGLAFAGCLLHFTGWMKENGNLTWAFVAFLVFAVPEYLLVRRFTDSDSGYLRLDGEVFPFFALGVAAAVLIV